MTKPKAQTLIEQAQQRIEHIRQKLAGIDYLCAGTLTTRTKTCGNPGCRCAQDPAMRHGPYYEWTSMKAGKLAHRSLSPQQADAMRLAIANYREVQELLKAWQQETERILDAQFPRTTNRHNPPQDQTV